MRIVFALIIGPVLIVIVPFSVKKFNNPTNDEVQGVASDLVSEIIEPLMFTWRVGMSIHSWDIRGSTIPPVAEEWVSCSF